MCLIRGMISLERDNLVVIYYISASEIWLDKREAFNGMGLIRERPLYINVF
jgi:hypothetical protein